MFPFMASLGYNEYELSGNDQSDVYSKYEFRNGDHYISVYSGLNRLDYNDGIQVNLYTLGGAKRSIKESTNTNDAKLFFGYSDEELDNSMERIKDCISKILCTTSALKNKG